MPNTSLRERYGGINWMMRRYYVRRTLEMTRDTRRKNYKHELRRKA